ncbi:hypothetical protein BDV95DRAFT_507736 [Massariosphaeria phaeospora]|uniref:Amine oxidase domain-containing protein n=1 Tax=Massariosphaeria phaeospora TaxID=100035 RepID=A0A7C8MEL4_9PLEO|nr:hypothetical protein BDV95DRAFT_507736 [Massariosphaeria phaeospora]
MFPLVFSITLFSLVYTGGALINEAAFSPDHIISKDVAIIGGGASGTYAAIRLREDLKTSIILIEKEPELGGHVETYFVPETQTTLEYGVQSYIRYGHAVDFFARFNVSIVPFAPRRLTNVNVNAETGALLEGYIPPTNNATTEAFQRWLKIVEKYESILNPGYWEFPAPDDIPSDLLLPFGEFAAAHNIAAAVPRIMTISGIGVGGIKTILTLYVAQAFGAPITRGVIANSLFVPEGSNSLLYQRALTQLGSDVLLSSQVRRAVRDETGIRLVVKSKRGSYLIKAKRLLYSAAPSLHNLANFDVDEKENKVFGTWTRSWSFLGVAHIPCILENYGISYVSLEAVPSDHLAVRNSPFSLGLTSTGPAGLGLFRVLFASNYSLTYDEAKATIQQNVQNLVNSGTLNYTGDCAVEFKTFTDHHSVTSEQTSEQLRAGFIQDLYALQGYRSTWYTGSLWGVRYSSNVWAYTDTVLPRLLADISGG